MWASNRSVSAVGPLPTPEQMREWRRRMGPPDNELPAGVGLTLLLGRTDDAAVGITHIEAYSTGFRFTLAVRLREARPGLARGGLFMLVGSHAPPGVEISLEERLLLGIEYPNGEKASTLQDMRMLGPGAADAGEQRLILAQQGGGGGEQSVDQTYWVHPMPGEGPITFILAWPAFGLPESRTVLDSAAIRAASARSQVLWPPQPDVEPPEPPSPPRPSRGWFADPQP